MNQIHIQPPIFWQLKWLFMRPQKALSRLDSEGQACGYRN
jgi:hypothetical protein